MFNVNRLTITEIVVMNELKKVWHNDCYYILGCSLF